MEVVSVSVSVSMALVVAAPCCSVGAEDLEVVFPLRAAADFPIFWLVGAVDVSERLLRSSCTGLVAGEPSSCGLFTMVK